MMLCITAAACSDKPSTEKLNSAMDEMKGEVENLRSAVVGEWECEFSLADVLTEVHHTVWDKNMAGTYTVSVEFTDDGKVKLTSNDAEFEEALRTYFLGEEYSDEAAKTAAKHYGSPLKLAEELTYTYASGRVKLSTGMELVLSDDGKTLTVDMESVDNHDHEGETCETYNGLLAAAKTERVEEK